MLKSLLIIIYTITIFLCVSTYFLYPFIIWIWGKLFPFRVTRRNIVPFVSIIIPAYNEAKNIEKKVKNTLSLDYPKEKMEILIGSDGSTDETAQIVQRFLRGKNFHFFNFKKNRGKTSVQNDLVKKAKGEILIFTDAASYLNKDAIKKIVRNFADNRVGCVAGFMRFTNTEENLTTRSQGIYWRYESKLRDLESRIGQLIGVDGPLYAIKKDFYIPLEQNIISDLVTPLLILEKGKKVILEKEAIVNEAPTMKSTQEFSTRRRIVLRGLVSLFKYKRLLNPLKNPILAFQIILHKILRWFVGPLLLINILTCFLLIKIRPFNWILAAYFLFFLLAILGWIGERYGVKAKIFIFPYYFSLVNIAAFKGIIDFLRKKQIITWKPIRN